MAQRKHEAGPSIDLANMRGYLAAGILLALLLSGQARAKDITWRPNADRGTVRIPRGFR